MRYTRPFKKLSLTVALLFILNDASFAFSPSVITPLYTQNPTIQNTIYASHSYLAGIGIRSSLQVGLAGGSPSDIWASVAKGLLQGVASIGINYATQELGLNPLLANIGFSAISTAINAGIQTATGQIDPDTGKPIDYFKSIYDTYTKNALTFLGGSGDAWQQSAYMAQIQDFTKIVMDGNKDGNGLMNALNAYATGFFNATAVNAITSSGMTIGAYFAKAIAENNYKSEIINGKTYKAVDIRDKDGNLIGSTGLFDTIKLPSGEDVSELVGKRETTTSGSFFGLGKTGVDAYGKFGFTDAAIEYVYEGIRQTQTINGTDVVSISVSDSSGKVLERVTPLEGESRLIFSINGSIENGQADYISQNIRVNYQDGHIVNVGLLTGNLPSNGTTTLVDALDSYNNPLFDISNSDRAFAKQNYDLFIHDVAQELKTRQSLTDQKTLDIENSLKSSGHNIIDNPTSYNIEKQTVQEATGVSGMSVQCAADLGTIIQEKSKDWGVNMSLEGGNLNMAKGFLVYFAGDFIGDTLRLGEGTAEAMTLFETGHPVKGTLSLLGDLGRATMLTQGLSAIGKALSLSGGIAGTVTSESTNALRNMFRVGEKVYEYGDDVLRISPKSPFTFTTIDSTITGVSNFADDTEHVVYRLVKKGVDPLDMTGLQNRWNSAGTKVLYTSTDLDTTIAEGLQYLDPGDTYEVYKIVTNPLGKTLDVTSGVPTNELTSQLFGSAVKSTDYINGFFVPSKFGSNIQNLILKNAEDIKGYVKLSEGVK